MQRLFEPIANLSVLQKVDAIGGKRGPRAVPKKTLQTELVICKGAKGDLVTPNAVADALYGAAQSYESTGDVRGLRLALLEVLRGLDGR